MGKFSDFFDDIFSSQQQQANPGRTNLSSSIAAASDSTRALAEVLPVVSSSSIPSSSIQNESLIDEVSTKVMKLVQENPIATAGGAVAMLLAAVLLYSRVNTNRKIRPRSRKIVTEHVESGSQPAGTNEAADSQQQLPAHDSGSTTPLETPLQQQLEDEKYVGLYNEGATCYLNSLLQTLFHINEFRRVVFQVPTGSTAKKAKKRQISRALQSVFYKLQCHRGSAASTRELIESFGWSAEELAVQHDVQELAKLLFEELERDMKGTPVSKAIKDLFQGKTVNWISCINVAFESEPRMEVFYDLSLDVVGQSNIYESLRRFFKPEILDGDNMYRTEEHGLQLAEKCSAVAKLPPVLFLHLKRFAFLSGGGSKVNTRFEFYDELDLSEFVLEAGEENGVPTEYCQYSLHSVLVHQGTTANAGHYFAFINTSGDPLHKIWHKFDDDKEVSVVPSTQAIESNYGGPMNRNSAYMLVYIRKSELPKLMRRVKLEQDLPQELRERLSGEAQGMCAIS